MNLRAGFGEIVMASDASTTGGGVVASRSLTPYGMVASRAAVRGDLPEEHDFCQILSIGLFDGIAALRVALDCLEVPVVGHISVEKEQAAQRVVESAFADVIKVDDVQAVTQEMVRDWALRFPSVGLILIGAGPPCQGVSGLNYDRKGALKDQRSNLFTHVPRIAKLVKRCFPWAQVHTLAESVASMDFKDCQVMNEEFEDQPWYIDANGMALCHRPRLYWVSWELCEGPGVSMGYGSDGRLPIRGEIQLLAQKDSQDYLESGWHLHEGQVLPTFTTSRPSPTPLKRPAGLKTCQAHERARWQADMHRFPPYQYRDENCVTNRKGAPSPNSSGKGGVVWKTPESVARTLMLCFPEGSALCMWFQETEHCAACCKAILEEATHARIDQEVDLEVAAASAAAGSSFTATAATLPRASMAALDEPPPAPKLSLPGCGPVPGIPSASTGRASFAASASRRSVISSTISEYALGDDRPSVVASATSRTSTSQTPQVSEAAKRTSAAQRKSIADLAESRKSLVEVMKMYGPDEETTVEAATSRTSLSGWYAEDKKTGTSGGDAADAQKRESLSSWYNDGKQPQAAPPDPSKVVSMEQGKEGDVSVPSTVARDLTEKDAEKVEESAPEAKAEA
eukprot:s474_g14.t1